VKTAQVISFDGQQAVKLPPEFAVSAGALSIRKDGDAIILETIKGTQLPEGFFEDIRIGDPAFCRPPQGQMPAVPELG
jgi:virulence-associated protein VagC